MKKERGSNQYQDKNRFITRCAEDKIFLVIMASIILQVILFIGLRQTIITPCQDTGCAVNVLVTTPVLTQDQQIDAWVDTYSGKYASNRWHKIRTKALLHFLLLKEQAYGGSNHCGDSGLACGPLQFHEPTYEGYRAIMIRKGLAKDEGSRLDMENAIDTAAWAINNGREMAWGPVARGEITL